jgi:hypothetical protein
MDRYSRHRSIPVTHVRRLVLRRQGRRQEQETAKISEKARGGNGLMGGAEEPEGQPAGTVGPASRNCRVRSGTRWFAKGPVYFDQMVRAASKGGYATVVWLAVQARGDSANGASATTIWIAEITGLSVRTINKAVVALVEIGMLKRDGDKISVRSFAGRTGR